MSVAKKCYPDGGLGGHIPFTGIGASCNQNSSYRRTLITMEHSISDLSDRIVFNLDVDGSRYILIKTEPAEQAIPALSPREREIVRMVALGHQNKVIAGALHISSWTVSTHLRRIFTKLGVSSRAAMVAKVSGFEFALLGG